MIFGDTETTGLLRPDAITMNLQPFITEIYFVKLSEDFQFVDEINTFVKPPIPIPDHITKLTGITDEHVEKAPTFLELYERLVDFFIGERVAVGHNISFDLGMLYCELARKNLEYKFPWPQEWICTVEKSLPIQNKRLRLSQLHELATGKPHENAHRAKEDTFAVIRCYLWLKEQGLI